MNNLCLFVSIELSLFYIKRNKSFVVCLDHLIPTIDVKYRPYVKWYGDKAWKVLFQLYHKYLKYFYIDKCSVLMCLFHISGRHLNLGIHTRSWIIFKKYIFWNYPYKNENGFITYANVIKPVSVRCIRKGRFYLDFNKNVCI